MMQKFPVGLVRVEPVRRRKKKRYLVSESRIVAVVPYSSSYKDYGTLQYEFARERAKQNGMEVFRCLRCGRLNECENRAKEDCSFCGFSVDFS